MTSDAPTQFPDPAGPTARLWLRALEELDPHSDEGHWHASALDLACALRAAAVDEAGLVELIAQAVVLQQFLLEVASRPGRVCDRAAIVRQAARLLGQPTLVAV